MFRFRANLILMMRLAVFLLLSSVVYVSGTSAQSQEFYIFRSDGSPSSITDIVNASLTADVLFIGEKHDDPIAHKIELELLKKIFFEASGKKTVTLSMEMFERDVQIVLDEYLKGLITENHFLQSSRPWPNYKSDYRPLIEFAKENKIKVIAANAPRRYVNMVSRNGRNALDGLSPQAKIWLAPLPFPKPSDKYAAKFRSLMGASPESSMGLDNILDSQTLWDATMADSIAKVLASKAGSLVIHVNGSFHSESRLGTVEQLLGYRKKTRAIVVTIKQVNDYKGFDPQSDSGLGDFVILTLAKKTPAN